MYIVFFYVRATPKRFSLCRRWGVFIRQLSRDANILTEVSLPLGNNVKRVCFVQHMYTCQFGSLSPRKLEKIAAARS